MTTLLAGNLLPPAFRSLRIELLLSTPDDLALIESYVRAYHQLEGVRDSSDLSSTLSHLLGTSPLGRIWIIAADKMPVGYVALCWGYTIEYGGRDAFVDEFFIVADFRGKGIGTKVLALLQKEAAQLGLKVLHLEAGRDNLRAQRLYHAAGFTPRETYFLMSAPLAAENP